MAMPRREYQSISHVKLVDLAGYRTYYVPNKIYEEMCLEDTWEKQLAILAKHRLNGHWSRFIRVIDGISHD